MFNLDISLEPVEHMFVEKTKKIWLIIDIDYDIRKIDKELFIKSFSLT